MWWGDLEKIFRQYLFQLYGRNDGYRGGLDQSG